MMTNGKPSSYYLLPLDPRRRRSLAWAAGLVLLFPLAWLVHPLVTQTRFSVCFFQTVLNRPCPLCGMTRAFACATHGQFAQAEHFHPLWALAAGIIVALAILLAVDGIWGTSFVPRLARLLRPLWPLAALATAAFGVWRWL
jgi:hypothetical protein